MHAKPLLITTERRMTKREEGGHTIFALALGGFEGLFEVAKTFKPTNCPERIGITPA